MIYCIESEVDLYELGKELAKLDYHTDGSGALMANRQSGGCPFDLARLPELGRALAQISDYREAEVLNVMVNRLPAGTRVPEHTDTLLGHRRVERWHLPVASNDGATWWDERGGVLKMLLGCWWGPVPYWLPHRVENTGLHERVHLVVDLDKEMGT